MKVYSDHHVYSKNVFLRYRLTKDTIWANIFVQSLQTFNAAICIKCRIAFYTFAFSSETNW